MKKSRFTEAQIMGVLRQAAGYGRALRRVRASRAAITFMRRRVPDVLRPRICQFHAVDLGREARHHPDLHLAR